MPMVTHDSGANQTDDAGSLLFVRPAKVLWDAHIFPYRVLSNGPLAVFAVIYSELSAGVAPSPQESWAPIAEQTK